MVKKGWIVGGALLFVGAFLNAVPSGPIKWGGDAESGIPHIFYDPLDGNRLKGFEYDIVLQLSQYLKRPFLFCSCDWGTLLPGLNRGQYDLILNAIDETTWKPLAQKAEVALSIPYYVTRLRMLVKPDEAWIKNLGDGFGKTIGVLKQAWHAEKILAGLGEVQKRIYDDEIKACLDLKYGRLDAVLLDEPEALYYAGIDKNLKLLPPEAVPSQLKYVVMIRGNDEELLSDINRALVYLRKTGILKSILQRWNLWNAETAFCFGDSSTESSEEPTAYRECLKSATNSGQQFYIRCLSIMSQAAITTLRLSVLGMTLAIAMGLILAVLRTHGFFGKLIPVYVEIIRGTPLLVQLLFIFYGWPGLVKYFPPGWGEWLRLSPFAAGVLALGVNYSAYEAENYRAGLASVPRHQIEAARALGMTQGQALRHVLLPQALRNAIPPVTNDFINLLQDSSLVSTITLTELTKSYQYLAASHFDYFGTGIMVALMYLLIGLPFVQFARWLEKRLSVGYKSDERRKNGRRTL